jgi:hypothetical protein
MFLAAQLTQDGLEGRQGISCKFIGLAGAFEEVRLENAFAETLCGDYIALAVGMDTKGKPFVDRVDALLEVIPQLEIGRKIAACHMGESLVRAIDVLLEILCTSEISFLLPREQLAEGCHLRCAGGHLTGPCEENEWAW